MLKILNGLFPGRPGNDTETNNRPLGDGKAVFFSEGSEQDFKDLQNEDTGMKKWFERLKNL